MEVVNAPTSGDATASESRARLPSMLTFGISLSQLSLSQGVTVKRLGSLGRVAPLPEFTSTSFEACQHSVRQSETTRNVMIKSTYHFFYERGRLPGSSGDRAPRPLCAISGGKQWLRSDSG